MGFLIILNDYHSFIGIYIEKGEVFYRSKVSSYQTEKHHLVDRDPPYVQPQVQKTYILRAVTPYVIATSYIPNYPV